MKHFSTLIILTVALAGPFWGQTRVSLGTTRETGLAGNLRAAEAPRDAEAAPFSVTGPTLGFVFDRSAQTVRRIPGIPGSATIGDPVALGASLSNAFPAPQQDYVVGLSAASQNLLVVSLSHGLVTNAASVDAVPPAPDVVAFSPSGDSLAVFYANSRRVVSVTGLPASPQVGASWDLTAYPGDLTALAIKDGGDLGLAGLSTDSIAAVMLLSNDGSSRVLLPMGRPTAMQFLWGRADALVTDGARGQVYALGAVAGSLNTQVLARPEDGLANPDLIAVDRFAHKALVGQLGGSTLLQINLADSTVQQIGCDCRISALQPLNGTSIYRLTGLEAGQVLTIDASGDQPGLQTIGSAQIDRTCNVARSGIELDSDSASPDILPGRSNCSLPAQPSRGLQ